MRLLAIEDDIDICNLLTDCLAHEGFQVDTAHDGPDGLQKALSGEYDFVILDVQLPGLEGFDVLRSIRQQSEIPILMLTVCNQDEDRIKGLHLGADDYLSKPFNIQELHARIRNILRRTYKNHEGRREPGDQAEKTLEVGDLVLDSGARRVFRSSEEISLTAAEFNLLEILLSNAGEIVPREELVHRVQGRSYNPYDRSIDVHISRLRKKLAPHHDGSERIKAVRGAGHLYTLPSSRQKGR